MRWPRRMLPPGEWQEYADRTDGQTDGRQTVTLRISLNTASIKNVVYCLRGSWSSNFQIMIVVRVMNKDDSGAVCMIGCSVVMPPVSANARPRCLRRTSVDGVKRPASSLSPQDDHLVVLAETHGSTGVLASVTALELGVGMASCPWLIVAAPGQRINITMMDFATYDRLPTLVAAAAERSRPRRDLSPTARTGGGQSRRQYDGSTRVCRQYAVVSDDTAIETLVGCSDHRPRTRLVYTSRSHKLQVTFTDMTSSTSNADDVGQPYFAIKYQGSINQSINQKFL